MNSKFREDNFVIPIALFGLVLSLFLPCEALSGPPPDKPIEASKHNPRMSGTLELLAETANSSGGIAARKHASRQGVQLSSSNRITVIAELEQNARLAPEKILTLGGSVLGRADNLIEIKLPVDRLEDLVENNRSIHYLRTPYTPLAFSEVEYGSYFSNGVNLTGGGLYHSKNLLGRGVKIAVIDVGFGSFNYAREDGDLPGKVIADTKDYTGGGFLNGGYHGTAVAEIVHDMAPLSELYLKRIDTEVSLANAVQDAISQGVDVVVHSVGWVNTNFGDGTGVIANTAEKAINNGILWVNAAGNSARSHWEGRARDRNNDEWLEFSNGKESIEVRVDYASTIQLFLTWNDWPESDKDFDLFLYDDKGNLRASSQNNQTGTEPPAESVAYSTTGSGTYRLKVTAPGETPDLNNTDIEIFSFNHQLDPYVEKSSVMAPGNVEEVLTVGSINKKNWKSGEIAYYSSRGPTADGRVKPDITGVDGVTTLVYGGFLGTSAAAPHAAGAAALIMAREPDLSNEEVNQALRQEALDLGETGPDNTYGWGKMRLLYKTPSGSRTINTDKKPLDPGDKAEVNVKASMPVTLQGGMELKEEVPAPLELVEIRKPEGATSSGRKITASWPVVESGDTIELNYVIRVPDGTNPGEYEFTGTINGQSIEGASTATVHDPGKGQLGDDNSLTLEAVKTNTTASGNFAVQAEGENIYEIRVKAFSLNGKEIFDSRWQPGQEYQWGMYSGNGETIPNGIFLYFVQVKGPNDEIKRSGMKKYLVLR